MRYFSKYNVPQYSPAMLVVSKDDLVLISPRRSLSSPAPLRIVYLHVIAPESSVENRYH